MTGHARKTAEEMLYGFVRRRGIPGEKSPLPPHGVITPSSDTCAGEGVPLDPSVSTVFAQDLGRLDRQNRAHLSVTRGGGGQIAMTSTSNFGYILGLLIMGSLFFISGFLVCYWVYPPHSSDRTGGINGAPLYNWRGSMAQGNQSKPGSGGDFDGALTRAEGRSLSAVKSQVTSKINTVINKYAGNVRGALGPGIGTILAPATSGLVQDLAGSQTRKIFNTIPPQSPPSFAPNNGPGLENKNTEQTAPTAPAEKTEKTPYTLHLGRFDRPDDAANFARTIDEKGIKATVTKTWSTDGKKMVYHVGSGAFKSYNDARTSANVLKAQTGAAARVTLGSPNQEKEAP